MNVSPHRNGFKRAFAQRAVRKSSVGLWARLPTRWFEPVLTQIDTRLSSGSLEATLPDGTMRVLGGRRSGHVARIHLISWRALVRLGRSGSVGWYEAWAAGEWSSSDPVAIFALFTANARSLGTVARAKGLGRLASLLAHIRRANSRRGARRNIAEHYDLGNDFYRLWLDETMTYSSAMPAVADQSLRAGQTRKIDALLDRLALKGGDSLLEIGCGWGSLAARALERAPVHYTGLTLSAEQQAWAQGLPYVAGAGARADIQLRDYRDQTGSFDAIASVEMVEAVGQNYWPTYLAAIQRLLKPGGRAAIQFISIDQALFPAYARRADFIQRYIFPGGCLIAPGSFQLLAQDAGLIWQDQYSFGQDYAWTLREWRALFDAAVEAGTLPARFDARFVAMWRYYLMYCEGGFLGGSINVSQVTLVKPLA
jgi:cyclopropane-fatty-acyl-phospholipid synthase